MNEHPVSSESGSQEALSVEYQVAITLLGNLDARIWAVYSVVTTVAVGSFVFMAQSTVKPFVAASVGLGVIVNLFSWWVMASRWWSYGDVVLARMRDIEEVLGLNLANRIKWSSRRLLPVEVSYLPEVQQRAYAAVVRDRPKRPFPPFSQRHAALASVIGLSLIHVATTAVILVR